MLHRRDFLLSTALAPLAAPCRYRIGITTNTRGGWEKDVFLSFREARQAGYRNVESFIHYFLDYFDKPEELQKKIDEIGVRFVTISNGGPLEMRFQDPARHEKILADHLRLVRFIKHFGCTHLKINMGSRRPAGTTDEDLRAMATVANELGRTLGHRVVEFHLKDVKPEYRGGAKTRLAQVDAMKDPPFFELGAGGVDFPALKAHLDRIRWQGWLTVELDSSPFRGPIESARTSREYIEKTLKIKVG